MPLTTIMLGPAGIGKSPLDKLFKENVIRVEPYRVREAPRGPHDKYYVSQEVRDRLRLLCHDGAVDVLSDIEIYPLVSFFRVRDADQFLLPPRPSRVPPSYKVEVYAPVLARLLNLEAAQQCLPFLTGGKSYRVLIIILNPCPTGLQDVKHSRLSEVVEHAVACRHKLKDTEPKKAKKDIQSRIESLPAELATWKVLLDKADQTEFCVVDVTDWEHLEYTYRADPVCNPDQVVPLPEDNLLGHQKAKLKSARNELVHAVNDVAPSGWGDALSNNLLSDNKINKISEVFV